MKHNTSRTHSSEQSETEASVNQRESAMGFPQGDVSSCLFILSRVPAKALGKTLA